MLGYIFVMSVLVKESTPQTSVAFRVHTPRTSVYKRNIRKMPVGIKEYTLKIHV